MDNNVNYNVPECGASDGRNHDYNQAFTSEKFYSLLVGTDSPLIIDIGAHVGETIRYFKNIFPKSEILSFEPDVVNFEKLKQVAGEFGVECFNFALGSESGEKTFYKQEHSHLGSLKEIDIHSKDSLGYAERAKNEERVVKCLTLDTFILNKDIKKIDLLKIDVQGFELDVLKGAKKALEISSAVSVEISLFDFYKREDRKLGSIINIFEDLGFELYDIIKISKNPSNLRTDWFEGIFRKLEI